ncbi:MAG TPA: hypothetical protein VJZ75_01465 [Candidatus Bathyarchaeia archaeon]|nr:hypothetical protein [Candidatus Bathyarchaeia archaeon]
MSKVALGEESIINHGLAFLNLLGFMVSFLVARVFTTIKPSTWVLVGGIHIHHFWYGLGLIASAGWLGIISTQPTHRRVYALVFGLGGGLIGDEVGLLLTFGDYHSDLTYVFLVVFVTFVIMIILLTSYRNKLRHDVLELGTGERIIHIGVVVAFLSVLVFSLDALLGSAVLCLGVGIVLIGRYRKRHLDHPE